MPLIDVGYQCDEYNDDPINHFVNKDSKPYFLSIKNTELMCQDHIIYQSSPAGIALLTRGNNYNDVNEFRIRHLTKDTNLYAGDRLHILDSVKNQFAYMEDFTGYVVNYEAKCKLPNIKATLRLKVNGTVQKFKNNLDKKFGKIDTYVVDRREIKDIPIGCHAVPDEMKQPAFNNFYELLYSTSLLMFNETTQHYIEVNNTQSLISKTKYKCILNIKSRNSKIEKPDYIKETDFVINVIYEKTNKSTSFYNSTVAKISTISNGSTGSNNSTVAKISTILMALLVLITLQLPKSLLSLMALQI
uniref:Uncharacterized protein n=1 Tax=Strongyloides papillosus TaxID=174720 RepID=A0A0N5C2J2_STREA